MRHGGGHIERGGVDRCHDQIASIQQGLASDVFMPAAHRHFIHTALRGAARLAKPSGHAGQILQFKGDMFEDMRGPRTVFQSFEKATLFAIATAVFNQGGQQSGQTLVKAREGVGG